jgi:hypothetical protein
LAEIAGTNSGCAKNPRQGCRTCERIIALRRRESDLHMAGVTTAIYREAQAFGIGAVGILDNGTPGYSFAYIRRGFPCSISLPAADFVRHAGELFGRWPIERVTLTDRAPGQFGNTKRWFFSAWSEDTTFPLHTLPFAILTAADGRLVRGGHVRGQPLDPWEVKDWETDVEANAAVSDACVRYGRELAGLPGGRPEGQVKQTSVMLPNLA